MDGEKGVLPGIRNWQRHMQRVICNKQGGWRIFLVRKVILKWILQASSEQFKGSFNANSCRKSILLSSKIGVKFETELNN